MDSESQTKKGHRKMKILGKGWAMPVLSKRWAFVASFTHWLHRTTRYKFNAVNRAHWVAWHKAIGV